MIFWKLEECYEFLHALKIKIINVVFADKKVRIRDTWEEIFFDENSNWYCHEQLIAHACGGHIRLTYSNSKEALQQAIDNGFRVIEVDLRLSSDGKVLCCHDFPNSAETMDYDTFMVSKIDSRFTPMNFEVFTSIIEGNNIDVIADIKKDYEFEEVMRILNLKKGLSNVCIQIGKEGQLQYCGSYPVLYNLGLTDDYKRAVAFCLTNDIHTVSISAGRAKVDTGWRIFCEHGIRVFAHTVNRLEEYSVIRENGVSGVFTDTLIPEDLKMISSKNTFRERM